MATTLTLAEAIRTHRLDDFIAQAEAEGVEAANREMFDRLVGEVTAPQPEGQTSLDKQVPVAWMYSAPGNTFFSEKRNDLLAANCQPDGEWTETPLYAIPPAPCGDALRDALEKASNAIDAACQLARAEIYGPDHAAEQADAIVKQGRAAIRAA